MTRDGDQAIEAATRDVTDAPARGRNHLAWAYIRLAHALTVAGRSGEARSALVQAVETARDGVTAALARAKAALEAADSQDADAVTRVLAGLDSGFLFANPALHVRHTPRRPSPSAPLAPRPGSTDAGGGHSAPTCSSAPPASVYEEIAAGYVAVKLLGPFLESFAGKLGEQLGESVGKAIVRISLRRPRSGPRRLSVRLPDTLGSTTLKLPEQFTEEAKLAIIDLDLSAEEVRGRQLHWDPVTGAWKAEDKANEPDEPDEVDVPSWLR
jgi:hypothetical protein